MMFTSIEYKTIKKNGMEMFSAKNILHGFKFDNIVNQKIMVFLSCWGKKQFKWIKKWQKNM